MNYDSKVDTKKHIKEVSKHIGKVVTELKSRAVNHDKTKLGSSEKPIFDEFTPKLKNSTYGSEEYKGFLKGMKPALDHHYFHNDHHPEFFTMGPENNAGCAQSPLERMNLIQLTEMVCDWYAASKRHEDGDIMKSISINQDRFGYSDELKSILEWTAGWLMKQEECK